MSDNVGRMEEKLDSLHQKVDTLSAAQIAQAAAQTAQAVAQAAQGATCDLCGKFIGKLGSEVYGDGRPGLKERMAGVEQREATRLWIGAKLVAIAGSLGGLIAAIAWPLLQWALGIRG